MDSPFWGIIPGKASLPLGQITLPVQFDTAKHFCVDYVNFLIADFNMVYHAILGRQALAKFMAVLHYTYLVLKMPREQGVLSLRTNLDVGYNCEKKSFMLAKATDISICMQYFITTSQLISLEDLETPTMEAARASTKYKEVKEVALVPSDQSKTARIRAGLEPK
ncbi:uncharacterized protein [Miscanthus floridulus]|uniref:uncharacterized protein n=1 Tax=Miscanthus floridulus TaxID=154761 RepID=UPI003457F498